MCSGRRLNCRRARYPIRASGGIRRPGSTFAAASAAHKHSPLVRPLARSDMAFPGDAAPLAGTAAGFPSAWCALLAAPGAPSSPQGGNCGVFPICLVHFFQHSIAAALQDGRTFTQVETDLRSGKRRVQDLGPLRVVHYNGRWFSQDNKSPPYLDATPNLQTGNILILVQYIVMYS